MILGFLKRTGERGRSASPSRSPDSPAARRPIEYYTKVYNTGIAGRAERRGGYRVNAGSLGRVGSLAGSESTKVRDKRRRRLRWRAHRKRRNEVSRSCT